MSKKTLKDRLPSAITLEVKDPETGEVETTLKIVGNESSHFVRAMRDLANIGKRLPNKLEIDSMTELEKHAINAWFAAAHIVDWDPEYFGAPFSLQAAIEVFDELAASFILTAIIAAVGERESFFKRA